METNKFNVNPNNMESNGEGRTQTPNNVRPAGIRPAGARPAGARPAGARPVQGQTQMQSRQTQSAGVRPTSIRPEGARSIGQTNQVVTPQRPNVTQQGRQTQAQNQREVQGNRPMSAMTPNTHNEQVMRSSKYQRIIESKHIEFTRDANKKDYVLYMIIDKPVDGMLQYFRSYGLNVSKIFSSIDSARNSLMMQVNPARLVIVDTGNGAFNSMSARKQVIDIIGLGDDDNKVTIFYSDTNLKYEIEASKEIQKKALSWYKYKTTAHLLACMLQSKDCNYISDGGYTDASSIVVNLDETLLKNTNFKDSEEHSLLPMINSSDVSKLTHDTNSEALQSFNPILR